LDLVGDKWTLLIVRDLAAGPRRFVELQRVLPGISTEQLRSRLNRMVADGMLTRKRYREVPPRVDYELTPRSRALMPVLAELARWGYQWAWSPPRASERIDIGAIFRLAPGLAPTAKLQGEIELNVTDGHREGGPLTFTATLAERTVALAESHAPTPSAGVTGDTDAWVRALGPGTDVGGLTITGERKLAESFIDALSQAKLQEAAISTSESSPAIQAA